MCSDLVLGRALYMVITSSTVPVSLHTRTRLIPRLLRTTVNEAVKDKGLPIIQYTSNTKRALSSIIFRPILQLQVPYTLPLDMSSDLI